MIKLSDIEAIAAARSNVPALVSPEYSLSWSALAASVGNLVQSLRDRCNSTHATQAAFVCDNRPELVMLMAACATDGLPLTGVDYTLPAQTVVRSLRAIGADLVVLSSRLLGLECAAEILRGIGCRVVDLDSQLPDAYPMCNLVLPHKISAIATPARAWRSVLFTSGTSGDPKAVIRYRPIDARRFAYFTQRYGFHANDRFLISIPLYHVAGSGWARHFMSLGATLYLPPVDQPALQAIWVEQHRVSATVTTPVGVGELGRALERQTQPHASPLRFVLVGGKNFSPTQKRAALAAFGPVVYEYYGSTETGVNTIAEPDDLLHHPDTVGRPYDGNRLLILDEAGQPCKTNQPGRAAVSSYLMMAHYADGSANEVEVSGERFLLTPDHGWFDETGRLHVMNRSAGLDGNLDVYAVEERLRELPSVIDAAIVLSPPSASSLREVRCALVCHEASSVQAATAAARHALLEAGLRPGVVRRVDAIPYSLSGKVRVPVLEALLAA